MTRETQLGEAIANSSFRVTREGRVFSYLGCRGISELEIRQEPNFGGYPSVRIIVSGRRKRLAVHRIVADAFLPPYHDLAAVVGALDAAETRAAALQSQVERLTGALEGLLHAVCGETGFAAAVRNTTKTAYPWPALEIAEASAREALASLNKEPDQ